MRRRMVCPVRRRLHFASSANRVQGPKRLSGAGFGALRKAETPLTPDLPIPELLRAQGQGRAWAKSASVRTEGADPRSRRLASLALMTV